MKKLALITVCLGGVFAAGTSHAIDLKQSKLTQVVNDVQIISAADQKQKVATVNDIFAMPDILRTGPASRAELVAEDETITRVGANTIFSFDPANRTIDLKQGSLLFHSPHGKGGGTIHTGSATASVLGTTFIITTTSYGGLKVITLEGEVEVKFLNGLNQKLAPGQMTFVLPGANQLAPVIVFRLDELTENSLLVKGFTQPLTSLPLIQDQIGKQLKLILAGKFSDTGLNVGDNAGPNQVEVLDLNTISSQDQKPLPQIQQPPPPPNLPPNPPPPPPPSLDAALGADATINQQSLTDGSIPTPPVHVFLSPFGVSGNNYLGSQTFAGFVARNIFFNTTGGDAPVVVNMAPYSSLATFDFVTPNNISFAGSVTFKGQPAEDSLAFIAGNQIILTPGIAISAAVNNILLSSAASMTFDDVGLANTGEDINLNSSGDVVFQDSSQISANRRLIVRAGGNLSATDSQLSGDSALLTSLGGTVSLENTTLNAPNHAIFLAPAAISLDNSTINSAFVTLDGTGNTSITIHNTTINAPTSILALSANNINVTGDTVAAGVARKTVEVGGSALNADAAAGTVSLTSSFGSVNVSGTSISAHYLTLNSGDGILLDATGHTLTASGPGAAANFNAPNLITVNNADFSSYAILNMAANTIVLNGDTLAAISNFGTQTGLFNVGGAEILGGLNIYNCKNYLGAAVTSGSITASSGPGTSTGIYSYALK